MARRYSFSFRLSVLYGGSFLVKLKIGA
ncbi:uncharacterized protein G2W53_011776 [Senna tora]|uniref:Uncharacterized protein n=1 Tax=Senna tora TaxID=362788 RepID=A0A834WQ86_9FABA|nr:uncharacterized protein G2W53_011776 [Senna tora]